MISLWKFTVNGNFILLVITCALRPLFFLMQLKSQGRESTTFAKAPTFYRSSIKVVEILGYSGSNRDVEFVIYIMKNIFSLEKLVIDPRIYGHYPSALLSAKDIEMEKKGRAHAMEKLKPIVRKTIEFVCL